MKSIEQIKHIEGKINVLVSAPHVFIHPRKTLEGHTYRQSETATLEILKDICLRTKAFGISLNSESSYDPNFEIEAYNPYKADVRLFCRQEKIKYFIDLHIQNRGHLSDINIFYKKGFRNSQELAYIMGRALQKGKLKDALIMVSLFKNDEQETLSEFVCTKLGIPAIEIEMSIELTDDDLYRVEISKSISDVLNIIKI